MRISDWSSDVCSSDLSCFSRWSMPCARHKDACDERQEQPAPRPARRMDRNRPRRRCTVDRKSVVSGKSVSVRVDHGGRGIIKKKTEEQNTRQHTRSQVIVRNSTLTKQDKL